MLMQTNDILWKGILEDIFDDFLHFFFKNADELFNMEKGFQFLDKELAQIYPVKENTESPKFVDKLVQVAYLNPSQAEETTEWILIHIEVQGYKDNDFGRRMFTYFYRIFDAYGKPVTAIAILTDNDEKYHPEKYEYELLGSSITYRFNTHKIIDQDEGELSKNKNPFAIVVLTVLLALKAKSQNLSDEDIYGLKVKIARNLLSLNIDKKKIRGLMNFLRYYVRFASSEMNAKFDEAIYTITENKKTMGIEELLLERAEKKGIEKGIEKGEEKKGYEVVKNLIIKMGLSNVQIADIAEVPVSFVEKVREELK